MELFHYLGVADQIMATARPTPLVKWYGHHGGLIPLKIVDMAPEAEPTSCTPYVGFLSYAQSYLGLGSF
jgi:hypothetical protein